MRKTAKITSLLLLVLYLGYFASSNFFVHSHLFRNHLIVHSHPFSSKSHTHTGSEFEVIDLIQNATSLQAVEPAFVACAEITLFADPSMALQPRLASASCALASLRAPPLC